MRIACARAHTGDCSSIRAVILCGKKGKPQVEKKEKERMTEIEKEREGGRK